MNIKSARIVGVLQDWDINDELFAIELVNYEVPLFLFDAFSDEEIKNMLEEGYWGRDAYDVPPLGLLFGDCIEGEFLRLHSRWEPEDPCELKLEIEEDE